MSYGTLMLALDEAATAVARAHFDTAIKALRSEAGKWTRDPEVYNALTHAMTTIDDCAYGESTRARVESALSKVAKAAAPLTRLNPGRRKAYTGPSSYPLRAGTLAYLDTVQSGLVPIKVFAVREGSRAWSGVPGYQVDFMVTAARRAYPKGFTGVISLREIVPRKAVVVRGGKYQIQSYQWSI